MKIKAIFLIISLLLVSSVLMSGVAVKDVEYIKGNEYVQVYFKTDALIAIPDMFYPVKGNKKVIALKIEDVDLKSARKNFKFNSHIIRSVELKKENNSVLAYINLNTDVNYRVSSKPEGIFIEFPVVKNIQIVKSVNLKKKNLFKTEKKYSGINRIKGIDIVSSTDKCLEFAVSLDKHAEYSVIPIPNSPSRLAIDLKNVRSKRIRKSINRLNVKSVRGAYNNNNVYRLVFDLKNLNKYSVKRAGTSLRIIFGEPVNNKPVVSEMILAKNKEEEDIKIPVTEEVTAKPLKSEIKKASDVSAEKPGFFSDEKAEVIKKNDKKSYVKIVDKEGNENKAFTMKSIGKAVDGLDKGEAVSFTFYDMPLKSVILLFARTLDLNVVIDPGISGKVTCELKNVQWSAAMKYFLKINKLDMVVEGENNIIRIGRVDVLANEARSRRKLKTAREMEEDLEVFTRTLSFAKAKDVIKILKKQLSARGDILVDERTNTLIISEIPNRIKAIDNLIDTLDSANRQVSIEARIVETSTTDSSAFGIQWGYSMAADAAHGNQTSLKFPNSINISGDQIYNKTNPGIAPVSGAPGYAINLPAQGRSFGTGLSFGNIANTFKLDMAISTLQRKGKAKIISAPKTTTQNNMEATITQGQMVPVQTIQNNTVTVQYKAAALELKVLPQITAKGDVICTLDIKNDQPDFSNLVNGIPPIITQKTKTVVMVADGGTIVIGGLYKVKNEVTREGVPVLSSLPILGSLFRSNAKNGEKRELLIFITPRIIK